jgi:hypothetical protein
MRGVKSAQARTRAHYTFNTARASAPRAPSGARTRGEGARSAPGAADTQFASFLQIRRRRIGYSIYTRCSMAYCCKCYPRTYYTFNEQNLC